MKSLKILKKNTRTTVKPGNRREGFAWKIFSVFMLSFSSSFSFSFIFHVFRSIFFFVQKNVSSLFLSSCISFTCVSLLALASKFNFRCFLRCRCFMEMWCPDDIGRDSWDWLGPPAWVRACFNSPKLNLLLCRCCVCLHFNHLDIQSSGDIIWLPLKGSRLLLSFVRACLNFSPR